MARLRDPFSLELRSYPVREVAFGDRTSYERGRLTIAGETIKERILAIGAFAAVDLEFAHPGESTRIIHVLDAIEPRCKTKGRAVAFPGLLGPPRLAGDGITHRLRGFAILESGIFPEPTSGVLSYREGIIDMSGPAAPFAACSDTINLILLLTPRPGLTNLEFEAAARRAGLETAVTLAEATRDAPPEDVERRALGAVARHLPRVAHIYQVQYQGPLVAPLYYGQPLADLLPVYVHPNELLDGVVVSANYKAFFKIPTYGHCNNPVAAELQRRHGDDLNFLGIVLTRGHHDNFDLKERSAGQVAKLVHQLGADGVVLSVEGSGNTLIDYMLTVQMCERFGINAVPTMHEFNGPDGSETPIVYGVPEAVSVVSTGDGHHDLECPPMDRVIGGDSLTFFDLGETFDSRSALPLGVARIYGSYWKMALSGFTSKEF